jgi:uncharacterized protein YraI
MSRRSSFIFSLLVVVLIFGLVVINTETTSAQEFGTNPWNSQYYNSTDFTNPVPAPGGTPVYPSPPGLNFNWGDGPPRDAVGNPIPGVGVDNFSAVFTSTQNFQAATYQFTISVDDRARLTINGVEVINIAQPGETRTATVVMPGGPALLRVEYIEFTGAAFLQVQWNLTTPGVPQPGVPVGPTATPTPIPTPTRTPLPPIPPGAITATVINAAVLNVRDAPSLGGNRIGRILRGETYAIVGRDRNARWFLLQLSGRQGWAWGHYLHIEGNEFTPPIVSGNVVLGLAGQQDTGVRAQTQATMRLRAAPTVNSTQTGRVTWGAFLPVVGRTADNSWYQVVWKDTVGWVFSPYVNILEGDLNNVPIRG